MEPWLSAVITSLHPEDCLQDYHSLSIPSELFDKFCEIGGSVKSEDIPRHRANYARWWFLAETGGVWLDHDVIPLLQLTKDETPVIATVNTRPTACVLRLPPNHGLPQAMMTAISDQTPGDKSAVDASGDHLLAEVIKDFDLEGWELPLGSNGRRTHTYPWAVHTWNTSSRRVLTNG